MYPSAEIKYLGPHMDKTSVTVFDNDFRLGRIVPPQDAYYVLGLLMDQFQRTKEQLESQPLITRGELRRETERSNREDFGGD